MNRTPSTSSMIDWDDLSTIRLSMGKISRVCCDDILARETLVTTPRGGPNAMILQRRKFSNDKSSMLRVLALHSLRDDLDVAYACLNHGKFDRGLSMPIASQFDTHVWWLCSPAGCDETRSARTRFRVSESTQFTQVHFGILCERHALGAEQQIFFRASAAKICWYSGAGSVTETRNCVV